MHQETKLEDSVNTSHSLLYMLIIGMPHEGPNKGDINDQKHSSRTNRLKQLPQQDRPTWHPFSGHLLYNPVHQLTGKPQPAPSAIEPIILLQTLYRFSVGRNQPFIKWPLMLQARSKQKTHPSHQSYSLSQTIYMSHLFSTLYLVTEFSPLSIDKKSRVHHFLLLTKMCLHAKRITCL